MRGLAVNVGGKRSDELMGEINAIATNNKFNTQGRAQLVEAATALTDFRPDATNDQITATLGNLAMFQRATGVGGQEGFRTINSLQANLGLAEDEAVDVATTLVNSGFEAQTVQQLAERGGNVGGLDFMALLLAARGQGLNVAQSGEQVETLIGALTRRGADGGLAPELADLGVNGNMSLTQRLAFLSEGRRSGRVSRGQFERAIGGAQNLKVVAPLQRALASPGALASARATLGDDQAVENAIAALLESDTVQSQESADARELRRQRATEESGASGLGEGMDELITRLAEEGGGSAKLGLVRRLFRNSQLGIGLDLLRGNTISPLDPLGNEGNPPAPDSSGTVPGDLLGMGDGPVNNYTIIGMQLNNARDPSTVVSDRARRHV